MSEPIDPGPEPDPVPDPLEVLPIPPPPSATSEDAGEGWDELMKVLDRVPFVSGLKRDIAKLNRLVYQRRPPRLLAVGTPQCGRSQLLNALLGGPVLSVDPARVQSGAPGWHPLEGRGKHVDWAELSLGSDVESSVQAGRAIVDERKPDSVLLVLTPEDVARGLGHHLELAGRVLDRARKEGPTSLFIVLSKIDTLPPEHAAAPFPVAKLDAIAAVKSELRKQLNEAAVQPDGVYAVATPTPAEQRLEIGPVGLEDLAECLVKKLPPPAQVEAARAFPGAAASRRRVANDVVRCSSTLAITVAITPLPLSDVAVIAPLQVMMVTTLAYLSGRAWDRKTAGEWMMSAGLVSGAGFGLRWGAQQAVKFIPGMGSILSAGIAGMGTLALGRAALKYFLDAPAEV